MTRIDQLTADHWERSGTRKPQRNYQLQQQDTDGPRALGEGISRCTKPGARLFAMELTFKGSRPMRTSIRALNWKQAEQFARNRHPDLASIVKLEALPSGPQH
jgi:hypothetical protein